MVQTARRETWELSRLVPHARNARTHSAAQVKALAENIDRFGFRGLIIVAPDGTILAGHGRVLALARLGRRDVDVEIVEDLTEPQRRAFMVADNKLAELSGWDKDMLAAELADLGGAGFDLGSIGFSDKELAKLLGAPAHGQAGENDGPADGGSAEADVAAPAATEPGDIWLLGAHRLLCGDATRAVDVARAIGPLEPGLMVTDPPYGVDYRPQWRQEKGLRVNRVALVENDDKADWREVWRLFPGAVAYVWHAGLQAGAVAESLEVSGFQLRAQLIWRKPRLIISRGPYNYKHEPCWYAVREGATAGWRGPDNAATVWDIDGPSGKAAVDGENAAAAHSTQKPVECMRRPMLYHTDEGDAVFDPFLGSGTSIIAAETIGRVCAGLEISPAFCDLIVRRWQDFAGAEARLDGDGRTFAEVAAERAARADAGGAAVAEGAAA